MILNNIHDKNIEKSMAKVADFYDGKKVGDIGPLGFRRSTDLNRLSSCVDSLLEDTPISVSHTNWTSTH